MYALGIPTTRAASLVNSKSTCVRDPVYSGEAIDENCAIVCRLAPTFFRFGNFEIFKPEDSMTHRKGPSAGMEEEMEEKMLDFVIEGYFPQEISSTKR